ncbi:hypothetical protein Tco_1024413 [Tanacetum coccineum]
MNENETFNEAPQEKWVLTPTQMIDDLNLLSQLERDAIATLNERNESRKRTMCDFQGPSFDLGFSPLKSQKLEMKTNDQLDAKMIVNAPVPIAIEVQKSKIGGSRKSNRIPKLSYAHKSPYYKRHVSIEEKLNNLESKVSSCIFAAVRELNEFIFKTNEGLEVYRVIFESLKPKCEIHAGIIDLWSGKLNEEERHRNPNSIFRLFCNTGVLTSKMVKQPLGDFSLFHVFKQEMDRILKTYNERINEFDMKEMFMEYLLSIKDPNASTMSHVWPRRLQMAWRTTNNNKDCGVFVMRHMETYNGTSLALWNPGFKPEGAGQDTQLDDLRKKYVTRLLVWKNNILRKKVLAEVNIYDKLTPENKTDLNGNALERIEERLALWG